jgi:hypothetical protein
VTQGTTKAETGPPAPNKRQNGDKYAFTLTKYGEYILRRELKQPWMGSKAAH